MAKTSCCNAAACVEQTVLRKNCCKAFAHGEAVTDPKLSVHSVGHWCWPCIGKSRVAHCCHSPLRPLQSCASAQCRQSPARKNAWSCTRAGYAKLCTDRSSCLHTCDNAPQHLNGRPMSKAQRSIDQPTGLICPIVASLRQCQVESLACVMSAFHASSSLPNSSTFAFNTFTAGTLVRLRYAHDVTEARLYHCKYCQIRQNELSKELQLSKASELIHMYVSVHVVKPEVGSWGLVKLTDYHLATLKSALFTVSRTQACTPWDVTKLVIECRLLGLERCT